MKTISQISSAEPGIFFPCKFRICFWASKVVLVNKGENNFFDYYFFFFGGDTGFKETK